MLQPPQELPESPLTIQTKGWLGVALPQIKALRDRMSRELGENFSKENVYDWWDFHKDGEPLLDLHHSRFRWQIASLFEEGPRKALLTRQLKANALWGWVHVVDFSIDEIDFWHEVGMTTVTFRTTTLDPEDLVCREEASVSAIKALKRDRKVAEVVAASVINWAAATYGHIAGQHGANPVVLTKLFSAATQWGPGTEGWQQWDESWLCTDQKNMFGRAALKTGRTIWRVGGRLNESSAGHHPLSDASRDESPASGAKATTLCAYFSLTMTTVLCLWVASNSMMAWLTISAPAM